MPDFARGGGDPSNSQFAMLALYEAERVGVPVKERTWRLALDYWVRQQNNDGSWSYFPTREMPGTGSMTCAGIASVFIASGRLSAGDAEVTPQGLKCCGQQLDDPAVAAIEKGLVWLGNNFSVHMNPGPGSLGTWHLYYLYAVERVGRTMEPLLVVSQWTSQEIHPARTGFPSRGRLASTRIQATVPRFSTAVDPCDARSEPMCCGKSESIVQTAGATVRQLRRRTVRLGEVLFGMCAPSRGTGPRAHRPRGARGAQGEPWQLEALLRVEEEGRRGPAQDLVGMMIERDHGRPRSPPGSLGHEVVEEVGVAQVHAVEDADDHEGRTQLRPKRIDALDALHGGRQAIGTVGRPAGAMNTLSGASRPDAALAIATRAPSGAWRRYRSARPGRPPAGRTN
jgi:hypothetical protein